jgi:hypothetical protein
MIQPQSLDVFLGEYSELQKVWAIQARSGRYLAIPDHRFPGRRPVRFFTTEYDAQRVIEAVLEVRPVLDALKLEVVEVLLLEALRSIKADKTPPRADSFVINSPDEVYAILRQLKLKPTG